MIDFISGFEGYVAVGLCLICCWLSWKNGYENGTMKGVDATLTLMHINKAIRLIEYDGEQHIMLPDGKTPIQLINAKQKQS